MNISWNSSDKFFGRVFIGVVIIGIRNIYGYISGVVKDIKFSIIYVN